MRTSIIRERLDPQRNISKIVLIHGSLIRTDEAAGSDEKSRENQSTQGANMSVKRAERKLGKEHQLDAANVCLRVEAFATERAFCHLLDVPGVSVGVALNFKEKGISGLPVRDVYYCDTYD